MIQIIECDQGSIEWFNARKGIPTASEFATVMAKGEGKTRQTYMRKLAGEIISGEPMESYSNAAMERGKVMEDELRELYAFSQGVEPVRVGFIRNGNAGCSPDSLIGDNGGCEIKSKAPHLLIDVLLRDDMPPEHKAQVQGSLWITEREFWDFVAGYRGMPLFVKRIYRDEDYIKKLAREVAAFNDELAMLVDTINKYGQPSTLLNDLKRSVEAA